MEQLEREAPLFDRRLNVLVQYPDREEKLTQLTIRVLNGVRQSSGKSQRERVLRVEVTDDDGVDPYFLYLWSVSEEQFHELKAQQRLLVDFASFPSNLIDLLDCCLKDSERHNMNRASKDTEESENDPPNRLEVSHHASRSQGPSPLSYLAVLNTCDKRGECIFSIVETNQFKQLTHLSLPFAPGNDAAIKAYLAARLAQVNAEKNSLASTLRTTSSDLEYTKSHAEQVNDELEALRHQSETELSKERVYYGEEMNKQREQAAKILRERETELSNKLESITEKYENEMSPLRKTIEEQASKLQDLTQAKYQSEMKVDQLQAQVQELSAERDERKKNSSELQKENKTLDERCFHQEKQIHQLQVQVAALEQQVTDKEEVIDKTSDLLQAARRHNEEVEESLKVYRDNHQRLQQKLELSISEINKGNDIIERIHTENQSLKVKMKQKIKIMKHQEQLMDGKQFEVEAKEKEVKAKKEEVSKKDEEIGRLQDKVQELTEKLEEGQKLLASNQQVITWLNKEINDHQIGQRRPPGYASYRQSATARTHPNVS